MRIIVCIKIGDAGKPIDTSHPKGDAQLNCGCTILRRVPSAKKPVIRIISRMNSGNMAFWGTLGPVDLILLTRKNRVPASKAIPRISANRDTIWAGMGGKVRLNWAKIMIRRGITNPQNNMRWPIPGFRSLRIFL